eukprot:PhM_4_TR13957/c0_g1_i1/m.101193
MAQRLAQPLQLTLVRGLDLTHSVVLRRGPGGAVAELPVLPGDALLLRLLSLILQHETVNVDVCPAVVLAQLLLQLLDNAGLVHLQGDEVLFVLELELKVFAEVLYLGLDLGELVGCRRELVSEIVFLFLRCLLIAPVRGACLLNLLRRALQLLLVVGLQLHELEFVPQPELRDDETQLLILVLQLVGFLVGRGDAKGLALHMQRSGLHPTDVQHGALFDLAQVRLHLVVELLFVRCELAIQQLGLGTQLVHFVLKFRADFYADFIFLRLDLVLQRGVLVHKCVVAENQAEALVANPGLHPPRQRLHVQSALPVQTCDALLGVEHRRLVLPQHRLHCIHVHASGVLPPREQVVAKGVERNLDRGLGNVVHHRVAVRARLRRARHERGHKAAKKDKLLGCCCCERRAVPGREVAAGGVVVIRCLIVARCLSLQRFNGQGLVHATEVRNSVAQN